MNDTPTGTSPAVKVAPTRLSEGEDQPHTFSEASRRVQKRVNLDELHVGSFHDLRTAEWALLVCELLR